MYDKQNLVKLPEVNSDSSKPNLNTIYLHPEIHIEIGSNRRRQEIDNLITKMIIESRRRGRPRRPEGSK